MSDESSENPPEAQGAESGSAEANNAQADVAQFDEITDQSGDKLIKGDQDLEVILDIGVTVSLEVGQTSLSIRNLLQLNQGSVIELERYAGEPLDVLVNGTLIAHGEVVVVNEKFGIRLTDVVSPKERLAKV